MTPHCTLRLGTVAILLAALLPWFAPSSAAQAVAAQAAPGATVVSPEVLPDRRVTFRIHAPKAAEVTLGGDWTGAPEPIAMRRDPEGIWSVTVGPLRPDFYSYTMTVDGVRTLDPRNPRIKQGINAVDNMFFLPGPEAAFQDLQGVPHGEVRQVWYESSTLGTPRRMHVYTPPGYEEGRERYPVLYLLHGGGDDDSGWSSIGRAGFIMDNLLAARQARPMIVVMPNGSLPRPAGIAPATPGVAPPPEVAAALAAVRERFTSELMNDVIPQVEKRYRVLTGQENRAIAGLSLGGGQTLRAVASHPEAFAYVAIWSVAGTSARATPEFEQRYTNFLSNAGKVNRGIRRFEITVGEADFGLPASKDLASVLATHGIRHEFRVTAGDHTWINWRQYLYAYAPMLFQRSVESPAAAAPSRPAY